MTVVLNSALVRTTELVKATAADVDAGTEDAEYITPKALADSDYALQAITLNTQTDSYTLVLGDAYKLVAMNKGTAVNLTVPLNSSVAYAIGTTINIYNQGAGLTTVVATGGVTIITSATLVLRAQYSMAALVKVATDTWVLTGDLTAA